MKLSSRVLATALAAALLAVVPAASAQTAGPSCPAGVTNSINQLLGTWSYNLSGFVTSGSSIFFASAGQFTASLVGSANTPTLAITQTTTDGTRQETASGIFTVNSDCSGGTLTFYTSSRALTFDFWFDSGFTQLRLVSTTPGTYISGTARKF
jgi:predicted secreted protein